MTTSTKRKPLTRYRGIVSRRSGAKTVRVEMNYLTRHPKYGKILKRRTVAHVHDPDNQAKEGDWVEIVKCRPFSKTKMWRLLRIVESEEVK
ncbi:MAG: 30S ribosomal protein S17 [Sedimentisphaerales bacterium]|nr:30S ribosomal protein S17 [Sedimentisphaerales bacterium]